jgi:alpha-mannosidase
VVEQLGLLRSLEASGWKCHDGDLSHGETPDLDDSSWQTRDRLNKASTGVIWLRRWFEMPKDLNGYDLAGTRIWLQFRVDGHYPSLGDSDDPG